MPSIAKAKLDELTAATEDARTVEAHQRRRADVAEARVRKFDDILDKIRRASRGQSLLTRQGGFYNDGMMLSSADPAGRKVKTEQRQAQEIAALNERIVGLEARLAAVAAVTEFAQEHKA